VTDMHELLRIEREKVAKKDKQIARLAREVKKTFETQSEWIQHGIDRGWCSEIVCATHDGFSDAIWSTEEIAGWDDGDDPCQPIVRMWFDGDPAGRRANLYGADLSGENLTDANLTGAILPEGWAQ